MAIKQPLETGTKKRNTLITSLFMVLPAKRSVGLEIPWRIIFFKYFQNQTIYSKYFSYFSNTKNYRIQNFRWMKKLPNLIPNRLRFTDLFLLMSRLTTVQFTSSTWPACADSKLNVASSCITGSPIKKYTDVKYIRR